MHEPDLTATAENLRVVLAAVADPDDELTASPATRRRIEGAVLALETLAVQPASDASGSSTR
jgi:hypothetical protein